MKIIEKARNLFAQIDEEVDGTRIDATERNRTAGALYDIAEDHGKAIVVLAENGLYVSAFALLRPLFETYVRAAWVHHCANDDQIGIFISKDKLDVGISEMLSAVEKTKEFPETLSRIRSQGIRAMHSYTHGGVFPITRRLTGESIEPVFEQGEIEEVIRLTSIVSFLAFCGVVDLAKSDEKTQKLYEVLKWVETWCFNTGIQRIRQETALASS